LVKVIAPVVALGWWVWWTARVCLFVGVAMSLDWAGAPLGARAASVPARTIVRVICLAFSISKLLCLRPPAAASRSRLEEGGAADATPA
jgi:hypothetical protein